MQDARSALGAEHRVRQQRRIGDYRVREVAIEPTATPRPYTACLGDVAAIPFRSSGGGSIGDTLAPAVGCGSAALYSLCTN
jgi:hypothetical protein